MKGAPEEALAILDTVKAEANNTAAFSLYLANTLKGIASNVAANIKDFTEPGEHLKDPSSVWQTTARLWGSRQLPTGRHAQTCKG